MKKIEKELKRSVNKFDIDKNILQNVKTECDIQSKQFSPKYKYIQWGAAHAFAAMVLALILCIGLIPDPVAIPMNTYVSVSFATNEVVQNSILENRTITQDFSDMPAIELVLDEKDNIKMKRGLNNSGVLMLSGDNTINPTFQQIIENLVLDTYNFGFFNNYTMEILAVNSKNNKKQLEVENQINKIVDNVLKTNLIESAKVSVNPNSAEKNEYNLDPHIYSVIMQIKNKCEGKGENFDFSKYRDKDFEDLLEILYDFKEEELELLEDELEKEIELIEKDYEKTFKSFDSVNDLLDKILSDIDDLKEHYEEHIIEGVISLCDSIENSIKGLLSGEFKDFFKDFVTIGEIKDSLKSENIEAFILKFENKIMQLEEQKEALEDEMETKIDNYKKSFLNK